MEKDTVKQYFMRLSDTERMSLLNELESIRTGEPIAPKSHEFRRELLNNKQGCCAHCGNNKYVKFGIDKGAQRYKCKSCKRSFTEYTGTWMAGLHKKDKIDDYLELMLQELSLDKIKVSLKINKKTAFDWRHKILSSIEEIDKGDFTGITESDETFFINSNKGMKVRDRSSRKRGSKSTKRGINDEHVAVIVTLDRNNEIDLTVATTGRLKKVDLENAIGERLSPQTVLCSDSHVSYKGFAIDNALEHHPLRSDLKQRVKDGIYHIQHVNSTHQRIKKWISEKFWGVSTKYLQQYLNWFRLKEVLKFSRNYFKEFTKRSMVDVQSKFRFQQIESRYEKLISTHI